MRVTRRQALAAAAFAGAQVGVEDDMGEVAPFAPSRSRRFHYSVDGALIDAEPELLALARDAGITDIWLGWRVGRPPSEQTLARFRGWTKRIGEAGMSPHLITIPLGHPAPGPAVPRYPIDGHWGVRPDGATYGGTAYHPSLVQENLETLARFGELKFRRFFVDDDFRLAQTPFDIGGCFCPQHRAAFLKRYGYAESRWAELLEAMRTRSAVPVLRAWLDFTADELTGLFRRLRRAVAPDSDLGIMVMYLGSEKAGIRLSDYRGVPLRVGELMFDDGGFGPPKGKTDELFSVLFHRRFTRPELAYSETTAYPPERLSPRNGAAKLCTSTIADVRNTMLMCMDLADWSRRAPGVLRAAMQRQAAIHERVRGHTPRGPYKHFWGEHSRLVGGDWPYSLFLATGVPFEVTDRPAADGWTFLSDADAHAFAEGHLSSRGTSFVYRPGAARPAEGRGVTETLADLFALRRQILPSIASTPYVEQEEPVVCAWYPSARVVLLWNLQDHPVELTLRLGAERRAVRVGALDLELVEDVRPQAVG